MDDQKRQVEAGAGLQESRLNQDFIDLLKKYGTTVLLVLLVIMATYVGIQRYAQYQEDKTDQAFADLDNAANTPAVLLAVAEQWDGRASVWEIATIRAAKAYLDSARTRTEAGVNAADVEDAELLSDERVVASLNEAVDLFSRVIDRTKGSKQIFAQDARWGLATAHLGLASMAEGDQRTQHLDAASATVRDLIAAAEGVDPNKVAVGNARLELIELLRSTPVSIYETAALPESARFQPDPGSDALNTTRSEMNPGGTPAMGPQAPGGSGIEMTPVDPETRRRIEEALRNGDNPDLSLDPTLVLPPANEGDGENGDGSSEDPAGTDDPGSDDPGSDDPGSDDPPAGSPGQ